MHIFNKGDSPTPERGNYGIQLMRKGSPRRVQRTAEVLDYPRLSYPVWVLVKRALEALDRCRASVSARTLHTKQRT